MISLTLSDAARGILARLSADLGVSRSALVESLLVDLQRAADADG